MKNNKIHKLHSSVYFYQVIRNIKIQLHYHVLTQYNTQNKRATPITNEENSEFVQNKIK